MTDRPELMMFAVLLVAFIAGYAVVSYVVRKYKEGPGDPGRNDRDQKDPNPTTESSSALKSEAGEGDHRSRPED
jgi:hypothetical protein